MLLVGKKYFLMIEPFNTVYEILASKGSENSFYYTFSTLAQVISGIYAIIGTITLFRLENLFKVRDENIGNFKNIVMNDENENPFIGQEDMVIINSNYNYKNVVKIIERRIKYWEKLGISPIEGNSIIDLNLKLILQIFDQIELMQNSLRKFTTSTINTIVWCLGSLSLTEFIIENKAWFTIHILISVLLCYNFLRLLKKQFYMTFGFELNFLI